jgi:SAM-dependent methyltransferase
MIIFWIVFVILFVSFGLIVFIGAPYVPSRKDDSSKLFDDIDLRRGSVVVDLGSGDGKVLIEASKRGMKALGYELNPILYLLSKYRLRKYPKSKVVWGNYWSADLTKADFVFVFSAAPFMERIYEKLKRELRQGSYVASYGFSFDGVKIYKKIEPINIYKF